MTNYPSFVKSKLIEIIDEMATELSVNHLCFFGTKSKVPLLDNIINESYKFLSNIVIHLTLGLFVGDIIVSLL